LSRRMLSVLGLSAVLSLALAACGSSGSTAAPAASAPAASAPAASAPAAAAACAADDNVGTVKVSIENFAFNPSAITAKVGDTVTFTNGDSASHTATLDDGSCATPLITNGKSLGLKFTAAGTYPFHCSIHTDMKGTITVS
jgi:plastocyanin